LTADTNRQRQSEQRQTAMETVLRTLEQPDAISSEQRGAVELLVGELRKADEQLREADAKYRTLVEQIPAIVYIDLATESMATTYVSPQIEDLLGITPAEYIEDPDLWYKHLHPDDKERALATYLEGREAGTAFDFEYRLVARDGRVVWFHDSAVVVNDDEGEPAFIHGVMLDVTERKRAEEEAAFLSYHDQLTSLPNRVMFEEMLELSVARARRYDNAVAVVYCDIDNFKLVNDSLGHERGDELIALFAHRLREAIRETDLVARQGGDEFLIMLADVETGAMVGDTDGATLVAESVAVRIQEALKHPFQLAGQEVFVSCSIGIALFPHHAADASSLLMSADTAMYRSKKLGPGGYLIHAQETDAAQAKLSMTTRLRRAVESQNWILHYQPLLNLSTGSMTGVEALLRWPDPNGGLVPPGEFIPLAEEMGLIEVIGDWVVEEIARQDAAWRSEGLELELGFNLSPRQLWQADLTVKILSRLEAGGVDPRNVIAEITESTAMADPDRTQRILSDLAARGLRIAIDDFGTGYSSLSRLKSLPVEILKIDRSFVRDVNRDGQSGSMVRAVIQLAHGLGMTPLAEGIETEEEWRFLVENGCTLGQGFLFSKPIPAADILAMWRRSGLQLAEARNTG
jgi:diguanylate cyclase (GGDEF)-like protein/PAS domain S-box-containing protein